MTTSAAIRAQLDKATKARDEAQARVDELTDQLSQAEALERGNELRRARMRAVLARMNRGEWPAGVPGRLWWHSEGKMCIERVSPDELAGLDDLEREGIVTGETVRRRVAA